MSGPEREPERDPERDPAYERENSPHGWVDQEAWRRVCVKLSDLPLGARVEFEELHEMAFDVAGDMSCFDDVFGELSEEYLLDPNADCESAREAGHEVYEYVAGVALDHVLDAQIYRGPMWAVVDLGPGRVTIRNVVHDEALPWRMR